MTVEPAIRGTVTFDFHQTLVSCDAWFDLEVRRLPRAFLEWRHGEGRDGGGDVVLAAADEAYRRLRQQVIADGRELTAEQCVAVVLAEIEVAAGDDEIAEGVEVLMRSVLPEAQPVPGAPEAVRDLAAAGVRLGVVSSAVHHAFLEWSLERLGLLEGFDRIVTSASAGFYKSRPEIYWHAAAALATEPGAVIHVGDSFRFDVQGARRAGMRTVWLRREGAEAGEGEPPDLTLTDLGDAASAILALMPRAAR